MNIVQMDSSSREEKIKDLNMGKVWLPFLLGGLLLKTEKTKRCSHSAQSEKILQK